MMAGITVLPSRSTRRAPAGSATSPLRPMRVIVPLSTRIAEFSIGGVPSPGIRRAPSNRVACASAVVVANGIIATARTNRATLVIMLRDMGDPLRDAWRDARNVPAAIALVKARDAGPAQMCERAAL